MGELALVHASRESIAVNKLLGTIVRRKVGNMSGEMGMKQRLSSAPLHAAQMPTAAISTRIRATRLKTFSYSLNRQDGVFVTKNGPSGCPILKNYCSFHPQGVSHGKFAKSPQQSRLRFFPRRARRVCH